MKHLSGLDASFLHLETAEMPMHVGGLNLFDLPAGYQGDFYEEVKRHVASRMHLASVFTKKLVLMPFELANPVWVDDDAVDLDYHVRKIHLPKPGSMAQLEAYVGRLHSSLLDRSRPLWEFYIFDGLSTGQAAFYSKIHHAALDGQGAAVMAQALLDISPIPREVPPPILRRKSPYQPKVRELLNAALSDTVQQCLRMVKGIPVGVKAAGGLLYDAVHNMAQKNEADDKLLDGWRFAPKTPLNVSITNQRVFATAKIDLNETKFIGKVFEASLNDVVMATCSGALREWLSSKGALPGKSLIAAMPVSLREPGNQELNNQVSMMRLHMASNLSDPIKRLQSISRHSAALKRTLKNVKSILPTDFPSLGLPWIMSGLVSLYGRTRLADKMQPPANVVISNVPGPQMDLYLAGAKMATNYPVSIVAHGLALNITVQSYAGAFDYGLIACRQAMPDIQDFAEMIYAAHQQLLELAKAQARLATEAGKDDVQQKVVQQKPMKKACAAAKKTVTTAKKPANSTAAVKATSRAAKADADAGVEVATVHASTDKSPTRKKPEAKTKAVVKKARAPRKAATPTKATTKPTLASQQALPENEKLGDDAVQAKDVAPVTGAVTGPVQAE